MEINAYNQIISTGTTNKVNVQTESSELDMSDFLNLLVTQITNQDSMNPMENTEYIAQLAQFSSLQAMSEISKASEQGQATSLIGKNVIVSKYNDEGILESDEGVVEKVTIYGGDLNIFVNGKPFELSDVYEIKENIPKIEELNDEMQDTDEPAEVNNIESEI